MITYQIKTGTKNGKFNRWTAVYWDGRLTGTIKAAEGGFRYIPHRSTAHAGSVLPTIGEVKHQLVFGDEA